MFQFPYCVFALFVSCHAGYFCSSDGCPPFPFPFISFIVIVPLIFSVLVYNILSWIFLEFNLPYLAQHNKLKCIGRFQNETSSIEEANNVNVSPLPAIRNSYQNVFNFETECSGDQPVIRMAPVLPRSCVTNRGYTPPTVLKRRNGNLVPKRKLLSTVRQTAKILKPKLPIVRDVNVIDKYARLLFPLLFIMFNITYWGYYLIKQHQNQS